MTLLDIYIWRLEVDPGNTEFYLKAIKDIQDGVLENKEFEGEI